MSVDVVVTVVVNRSVVVLVLMQVVVSLGLFAVAAVAVAEGLLCSSSLFPVVVFPERLPSAPCSGLLKRLTLLRAQHVLVSRAAVQKSLVSGWGVSLTTRAGTGAVFSGALPGKTTVPVGASSSAAAAGVLVTAPRSRLRQQTVLLRSAMSLLSSSSLMASGTAEAAPRRSLRT